MDNRQTANQTSSDTNSETSSETRVVGYRREDVEKSGVVQNKGYSSMSSSMPQSYTDTVDHDKCRYPHSVVWTPIPLLTWIFPFIGHMGICTMQGVIRDFAGPYYVSEDCMGFGNPTRYWQLDPDKVVAGWERPPRDTWDRAVHEASEEYKGRMHNLCCDNCHSHVAMALNLMNYGGSNSWNMIKLCFLMLVHGKFVSFGAFLKTWLPFLVLATVALLIVLLTQLL